MRQLQVAQVQHDKLVEGMHEAQERQAAYIAPQQETTSRHESSRTNVKTWTSQTNVFQKSITKHATGRGLLPRLGQSANDVQHKEPTRSVHSNTNSLRPRSQSGYGESARQELLARVLQLRACKMDLQSMLQRCQDDLRHERWRKHGIL